MPRAPRRTAPLVLALLLAAPAAFAWDGDPYLGARAVCTASGGQYGTRAVSDGAGGVIVTWYDGRAGAAYDLYAQRLNASGVPLWTANGVVVCNAAAAQVLPAITADGNGGAIIAWLDSRNSATTGVDLYAQRLNANGVAQWAANGIGVAIANADVADPTICPDGLGGAYLAWWDTRVNQEIFVQHLNAAGAALLAANGIAISGGGNVKATPVITPGAANDAICAWMDARGGGADIYANRILNTGTLAWGATGMIVCAVAGSTQDMPVLTTDGAGGAIIGWLDGRAGAGEVDLYARRIKANGTTDWSSSGVALCTAVGAQANPDVASDGAGGAIFAWKDSRTTTARVYVRRVTTDGGPAWTSDGVDVSLGAAAAGAPRVLSDGAGGAIVVWNDGRFGPSDLFAQRVNGAGTRLWKSGGEVVTLAEDDQINVSPLVADGRGGAIVAWDDQHFSDDVFAQRLSAGGAIGDPWPVITRVRDVPGDQGGQIVIEWSAASMDVAPTPVSNYSIWRRVPSSPVAAKSGARWRPAAPAGAQAVFWEWIGSVPARARDGYSFVAPTTTDSMPGSNPRTSFMVSAELTGSSIYYDSAPDSGYSVDNLAPATPALFAAQYAAGVTRLHWLRNAEADLAGYRLYRGTTPGFVPGPGNLVAALPDTGYADAGTTAYYKLTAVDVHGNESVVAFVQPAGTVGAPLAGPASLFLAAPAPMPLRAGATAVLRFGLPARGPATLALFDPQGRRVRVLADGAHDAGEHVARLDAAGLPAGLYLARLETRAGVAMRRVVVVP